MTTFACVQMNRDNDYDGDDGDSENGSLSFNEDGHAAENYMSLDESYSGNQGEDDDNEDMDIDDSYAESGSQMEVEGFYELNIFDNDMDESDVYASNDELEQRTRGWPKREQ